MNEHRPARAPVPGSDGGPGHDDLAERIAAALRSRDPAEEDVAAATERITAHLIAAAGARDGSGPSLVRRASTATIAGVVASAAGVLGAGAAAAANPYTGFAKAVEEAAHAVGVDWSAMPPGYTREQYEAFWDAGYTGDDVAALADLWRTDATSAKARAGQMIVDGETVPVAPNSSGEPEVRAAVAFSDAGYTFEDAKRLAELWQVDVGDAKVRAGRMIMDGQTVPVP
ncbi:hypothetical protein [Myceligenerans pegani]|uniref:Uncharacterized protein n=1 Tax=Myceligenerans pegani TaxID=2776917 RepID=A0ABR9MZ42_9MICO|nr:hypothetical protein [Myceligenerans sp. TRM 65318]MBE1876680.1 hypothetical protein [Myceligenerans sp. TRM 65318]MBE3018951.1 hypothetical protein [Myceligenerans sp. TRM 65318]